MEQLINKKEIRTFIGNYVDPWNPDPMKISIVDIAHSLSQICRFNGHTGRFYSVAEHCLLVASMVNTREEQLAALMHDASEAYLTDLTRPVKYRIEKYLDVEFELMVVISRKFGFQYPLPVTVKDADDRALAWEWENVVLDSRMIPRPPHVAKQDFLSLYDELMVVLKNEAI